VWGHHSYTGVFEHDPDLVHLPELVRKHKSQEHRPVHRYQLWSFIAIFIMAPNQYLGQIYAYWTARVKRTTVFSVPLKLTVRLFDVIPWSIETLSFATHAILPLYLHSVWRALGLMALHWAMSGIFYFMIVAPNHDTDATQHEGGLVSDWGEHQVRHSSNFSNNSKIITTLFGGMNYQVRVCQFPPPPSNISIPTRVD
jgi:hypothetical protein